MSDYFDGMALPNIDSIIYSIRRMNTSIWCLFIHLLIDGLYVPLNIWSIEYTIPIKSPLDQWYHSPLPSFHWTIIAWTIRSFIRWLKQTLIVWFNGSFTGPLNHSFVYWMNQQMIGWYHVLVVPPWNDNANFLPVILQTFGIVDQNICIRIWPTRCNKTAPQVLGGI